MAKKPKHFTINIATLIEEVTVSSTNLKEGAAELKKQVTEVLKNATKENNDLDCQD